MKFGIAKIYVDLDICLKIGLKEIIGKHGKLVQFSGYFLEHIIIIIFLNILARHREWYYFECVSFEQVMLLFICKFVDIIISCTTIQTAPDKCCKCAESKVQVVENIIKWRVNYAKRHISFLHRR